MRHRTFGKQLSRDSEHRRAMRKNLAASLIEHGAVRTTLVKAKETRPFVEKLITIARKNTLHARRRCIALIGDRYMVNKEEPDELADKSLIQKLFDEVAPRYVDRPGGYTRIIHLPERRIGDAGRQVLFQLVQEGQADESEAKTVSRRRRRSARRAEAAKAAGARHARESQAQTPAPEVAGQTTQAPAPEENKPAEGKSE